MAGKNKKTAPESGGNKRMKQEPKMSLAPPRIRSDDDFSQVFSQSQNLGENSAFYFSQSQQQPRGKSRGNKTGGNGARSKERSMKIRYSNVATVDQIEELKN